MPSVLVHWQSALAVTCRAEVLFTLEMQALGCVQTFPDCWMVPGDLSVNIAEVYKKCLEKAKEEFHVTW